MKKLFISVSLTIISFAAFSQSTFGVRAGLNIGALQGSAQGAGTSNTTGSHLSSLIEGYADFRFGNFSLQPALSLTGKGGNVTTGDGGVGQFALHYFQIPVNLLYHIPVAVNDLYFGGGPYLAFGTGGTLSVNGPAGVDSEDVTYGGNGDFSNNDSGIDMIAGLKLKSRWVFNLSYDLGLSNILNANGPESGLGTIKTRTFGFSAGYAF
ncbi:MAG TPA: outer membrane beta-barrel protein [Mucilaginibacter sp.]|jgi:hypothetical protein|nr:outer membrane beta-barrel protein [Mucilaginibacter sp.]